MNDARLIIAHGCEDQDQKIDTFLQDNNLKEGFGSAHWIVFLGPSSVSPGKPDAGQQEIRAVLMWERPPEDTSILRRWIETMRDQPDALVFVLHHSEGKPNLEGPIRAAAGKRTVLWHEYSHRVADAKYVLIGRLLGSVGRPAHYHTIFAGVARTLFCPVLEQIALDILTAFLPWDIELQLQMEGADRRTLQKTQTACQGDLTRVCENVSKLAGRDTVSQNPVEVLAKLIEKVSGPANSSEARSYGNGKWCFQENSVQQYKKLKTLFEKTPPEEDLGKYFEEFHARYQDLRDLLLALVNPPERGD